MNQERTTIQTKQVRAAGISALIAMTLAAAFPALAGPAADKCEGGKNAAAGTYFNCLAKAEKDFVTKGDVDKYDASVVKCETKLQATWDKLEAAATAAGDPCPNVGDAPGVKDLLDGCSGGVSESAAGGTPPPSPLVCEAQLDVCTDSCGCPSSSLPRTGQTTSYGAGSDGATLRGTARGFTDNGDGTITDNVTGLMWEKKSDDGSIHDKDNTYTWGMTSAPYTMNGPMVTTFLAALNGGGGFAGHTDWRIPNISELQSLVNFEESYPGPTVFPAFNDSCTGGCTVTTCSCTRSDGHWSSSTWRSSEDIALLVHFFNGDTKTDYKTTTFSVRAVRAGS